MKPATAQTTRYLSHIAMLGNTRDDILPPGYTSITRTPNGSDANLSLLNKNSQCYLCVRYAEHGLRVTSLALTPRKKKDFPPGTRSGASGEIGFFRMRKTIGGQSAKLGKKSQDAYLLVFKKVKSIGRR